MPSTRVDGGPERSGRANRPSPAEPRRIGTNRLWLVLLICALFTLLLTAVFAYYALGPAPR